MAKKYFKLGIDILHSMCYIIDTATGKPCCRKGLGSMENIEKALRNLEQAINGNQTVAKVKVTITLQKPKPSKANPAEDK